MKPLTAPTPAVMDGKRLEPLPLVGAMLRELAITDTLEALIPPQERTAVTVGECMEALGLTILTGAQALSRVAAAVAGDDVEVIFQRPMDAAHFHDGRVGRALDALWTRGLDGVSGAVISQAIRRYALELTRLHTETTSLKGYGACEREAEAAGPVVTFGDSRDHRPDLQPLRCGLTVTADGVPVWGHVTEGNRSDRTEHRLPMTQRRQHRPDLGEPLLVADSKFLAGDTGALAAEHRFRCVTLVPPTVGLRREVVDSPELGALPLLWERPGRRPGGRAQDHGVSMVRPYRWQTAAGAAQERPLRFPVVGSTPLAKAKAPRAAAAQRAERAAPVTLQHQWPRRTFACEAEAHRAATLCLQELSLHSQHLTHTVGAAWVTDKRPTRGRPPKTAPRPQRQVWRVIWQRREATELITARIRRDSRFVLATHVLEAEPRSDAERLRAYKGPPAAALSFKWAKNSAAMAPIFLETPTRLAALGCGYMLALLMCTPVARQVRNRPAARGETWPDRPAPSPRPTARTVFQLMRTIAIVTVVGAGHLHRPLTTLNAVQVHVRSLLGDGAAISARPRRNSG